MLTKWKLFNFKAIQQETELDFKPLTIFAGANSSGKSTVLQSILLVAQTLGNAVTNRPIVLNGDLVRLGQFDDIKSIGSEASEISIGWELRPAITPDSVATYIDRSGALRDIFDSDEMIRLVAADVSFDTSSGYAAKEVLQLQPELVALAMSAVVKTEEEESRTCSMTVRRRPTSDFPDFAPEHGSTPQDGSSVLVHSSRYIIEFDAETEERRQNSTAPHEIEGVTLRHFLPRTIQGAFSVPDLYADVILRTLTGESRTFLTRLGISHLLDRPLPPSIIEAILEQIPKNSGLAERLKEEAVHPKGLTVRALGVMLTGRSPISRRTERVPIETLNDPERLRLEIIALLSNEESSETFERRLPLAQEFRPACQLISDWFSSHVKYLGPLRDDPKPLYPLVSNIDPSDVGLRGEHTAAVFHVHRDEIIEYLPSDNFLKSPRALPTRARRSLKFATFDWLKYLGVASEVETKDLGKLGHGMQVRLHADDSPHDLTHVGVGVSQVLPIVVSCLLAKPDTLLIFEQPELHLHPRVQTLLGDFFLAMTMLGKQCILETHSEYLINRLRFRAAAAEGNQLLESIQIYFAEKSGNQAKFRPVVVNEYGAILDWPDGFFDQSQAEAEHIIREATKKRKAQKG